jgi:large subunit ribosomal protein L4
MELAVLNAQGAETGRKVTLPAEVFGITPNDHAIYLDVKQYLANQRQGTHKSKQRAEVAYSTRKIKKQKGTGGARAGSIKSPVFVGGGRVFGPQPRDYSFKLNKKLKRLARRSALAYKASGAVISIVEDLNFTAPKTKAFVALLSGLALTGKKTLFVTDGTDNNVYLSARNLPKTKVSNLNSLNTYEIMNADVLVLSESAVAKCSTL